ncbi:TetR family transcriptional regulator [Lactiplantibacillus plantarum]
MVDLCIHAGVSRKTFYRHFSSKRRNHI